MFVNSIILIILTLVHMWRQFTVRNEDKFAIKFLQERICLQWRLRSHPSILLNPNWGFGLTAELFPDFYGNWIGEVGSFILQET